MDVWIDIYFIQLIHGLVYGMLIFLVASGLTIVFGMMGVLNIAHAGFYVLGAYITYSVTQYFGPEGFWLSFLIAPLVVGILGVLIERFLLRKVHTKGHLAELLLTFGLFFIFIELVLIKWGSNPLSVTIPGVLMGNIPFLGKTYPIYRLFILGVSFLILIGMILLLTSTRIGIIIRAAVSDREMVDALGINVPLIFMGVFGGGAALAAFSGLIAAPFLSIYAGMGFDILLDCFVVIVVGGLGSLPGAFIASMMIGELHSFGIMWIPRLALVFEFLLLAAVLVIKPTGFFGAKQ